MLVPIPTLFPTVYLRKLDKTEAMATLPIVATPVFVGFSRTTPAVVPFRSKS